MDRKQIPETETRLTILYALMSLEAANGLQLQEFLDECCGMNYFTMQICLIGLEDSHQVSVTAHPAGEIYALTDAGKYCLESFAHKIPLSLRKKIDAAAAHWKHEFKEEQLCPASMYIASSGSVRIRLQLLEENETVLSIFLALPRNMAQFTFLQKQWQKSAESIYQEIMGTLSAGFTGEKEEMTDDSDVEIQEIDASQWLVHMGGDESDFSIMMFLPDENLAVHCAGKWKENAKLLKEFIIKAVRECKLD